MTTLFIINLICYVVSISLRFSLAKEIISEHSSSTNQKQRLCKIMEFVSITLHAGLLYMTGFNDGEFNLALGHTISLAAWMSVSLSLLSGGLNLGIIMMPIGLFGMLIGFLVPGSAFFISELSDGSSLGSVAWHIILSIPAYGFLCVAFAQAVLLYAQEKQLHKPNPTLQLKFLPALETMEKNLFWFTYAGFALLTINLLIGSYSSWSEHGKLLIINHHILLSLLSWFCFGFLVIGRNLLGWRGEHAAKWTILSFIILFLGYFGTRFVRNIILI